MRHKEPLAQARSAARAFAIAGLVLWAYFVFEEARHTIGYAGEFDPMEWLSLLGAALISGVLVLVPFWLPRWLLSGDPGALRRAATVFIARAVAVFALGCMIIAPLMFLFAGSAREWVYSVLGVALPLGVLVMIARLLSSSTRRAGEAG
jgi:hypothetical protein